MPYAFYIKLYLLTVPVFFAIDMLWLGWLAKGLYRNSLGHLLAPSVNWAAAGVFYLLYIVGILLFAVGPALHDGTYHTALRWGALFGFFTYATYDLTNLATLKDWPLKVVVADILWGTVLCATVAVCSYQIGRWLQA